MLRSNDDLQALETIQNLDNTPQRRYRRPGGPEPASTSASQPPPRSNSAASQPDSNSSGQASSKLAMSQPTRPPASGEPDMKPTRVRQRLHANQNRLSDSTGASVSDDEDEKPGATQVPGTRPTERTSGYASIVEENAGQEPLKTSNNDIEAPTIEAEIVDPEIEENRVRNELLQELQAKTPAATVVTTSDNNADDKENCLVCGKWKIMIFSFLVGLVVAIILAVVFTRNEPQPVPPGPVETTTTTAPSAPPSMPPTTSPAPTGRPTRAPSSMPTTFWTQRGESFFLRQSLEGLEESGQFGVSISFSRDGDIVAVGARDHDFGGVFNSGLVQVFRRRQSENEQDEWIPLGQNLGGEQVRENFGSSLSLSEDGNILVCGAEGYGSSAGRVYVFDLTQNNGDGTSLWVSRGPPIIGPSSGYKYGKYVSLSRDASVLAIGTAVGESLVLRFDVDRWVPIRQSIMGGSGETPIDLSADGTTLVESAFDVGNGRVRVHKFFPEENDWRQLGEDIEGLAFFDWFGFSVALSQDGTILAVGAPFYDRTPQVEASGLVLVFRFDNDDNSWNPLGQPLEGTDALDYFGISVALSGNGRVVATGATQQFADRNPPGYANVFRLSDDNSTWTQLGDTQVGFATDDDFGYSVALSGNGNVFGVGAPQFRSVGDSDRIHIGYVRILEAAGTG